MALGRISGPMLKADLTRLGVDLAFETDLLYLDVTNNRVGINTSTPQFALDIQGPITTDTIAADSANINGILIDSNSIISTNPTLTFSAPGNVIYQNKLIVDSLSFDGNVIGTNESNANLELNPNGTGTIELLATTNVTGDINISGNLSTDGNIIVGDENTDSITLNAEIEGDLIPSVDDLYDLGSLTNRWSDINVREVFADTLTANNFSVTGVDLELRQGNIYYVAENGDDSNFTGDHPQGPFASLTQALSVAVAGDAIHIYPGTYQEMFPLIVPAGVTVKGENLRAVNITPTPMTNDEDAFLINGGSTIEDLTVSGFFYNAGNNTGYAFRFAPGFEITSRSPYIRNCSVITQGSVTSANDPRGFDSGDAGKAGYFDGAVATSTSIEAAVLFHSVTLICPGVDAITYTNGVRIEWVNSFTYFADKGIYGVDGATGLYGIGRTQLRFENVTGTYLPGETVEYYDLDNTTLLASGTIESISADGKVFLDGKATGFETFAERANRVLQPNGNAKLSTVRSKFGSASLLLDGLGDYVSVAATTEFGFGTGDFEVKFFIYPTSTSGVQYLVDFRAGSASNSAISIYLQGTTLRVEAGSTTIISGGSISTGSWQYILVTRKSGITSAYINSTRIGTYVDTTNYGVLKPLIIGARWDSTRTFSGYIDELRIESGTGYSGPTASVPTSEFLSNNSTGLLAHFNGTNGSTIFIDDIQLAQDIRFSGGATSTKVILADYSDFGGELRSISSASIYGNFGAYGDGEGVIMYLVGHNMAYVGAGKKSDNDVIDVIQENEVVELNRAKIRFSSVDHKGDFRVGDLFYINQETGAIEFTSANVNFNSGEVITLTEGLSTTIISGSEIDTGNIRISGNTIEALNGDLNLNSASGTINLLNNVYISGNIIVDEDIFLGGNITIGDSSADSITIAGSLDSDLIPRLTATYNLGSDILKWNNIYSTIADFDGIRITGNVIETTDTNADLELRASGTGNIVIDDLSFSDATILSTSGNLILSSSNEIVEILGTGALAIPAGTTAERPLATTEGMLRYNTTNNRFEGYSDLGWIQIGGVIDDDGDTYITAELTPGANDNIIRFYTAGVLRADIDSTRARFDRIETDDLYIDGNVISTLATNQDIQLSGNGTGSVIVEDFAFSGNTITNIQLDAVTLLSSTGDGYYKFGGANGIVLPRGAGGDRPPSLLAQVGQIRWNTDDKRVEVYTGTLWTSLAGAGGGISAGDAENLAIEYALTLG